MVLLKAGPIMHAGRCYVGAGTRKGGDAAASVANTNCVYPLGA